MPDIIEEIMKLIDDKKKVSDSCFEGANIILYTKDSKFFLDNNGVIKNIVDNIKKRVELRPDPAITLDQEKAEKIIRELIPKEAGVDEVIFDAQRSRVIIGAEKPGIAIGKMGEILKEIRKKCLWVPIIRRTPALKSKIIENIRAVLYQNSDYRRKFLDKVGHRIYDGWKRDKKHEWVRITYLGGARQVGRSCILLQTPESRILMDCGINVAASGDDMYPMFGVPEFKIEDLDAVILSHAHLDHSGLLPLLYKMGFRGPTYCTAPTRDVSALLALDFIGVAFKQAKKQLFDATDVKEMVKHMICLEYGEVSDITPDIRLTFYNAGHIIGSALSHLHIGNGLHNLVYSLDWKTPVTILDSKDNVQFNPIGELIDKQFKEYPDLIKNKNGYEELDNIDGVKTIAFNPETYKSEIKRITSFIRHPINEDLYEIKTATGRNVTVTKSHSIFTVFSGEVKAVKVSDLKEGDFIIGPKSIPSSTKVPVINLFKHKDKLRIKIEDGELLDNLLKEHIKSFSKLGKNDRKEAVNWIIDHYKFAMYKDEIARKYKVHPRRVRRTFKILGIKDHPRVKHALPNKFTITKDFARFLGYYVSEGCPRKNSQTIDITNYSNPILADCEKIIKDTFNIESDVRYNDGQVLIHSKQIKYLISNVLKCGDNAYLKRVPKELLFADKEIMKNFLYGYFSGDGGIRTRLESREIMAGSKSKLLIQDLVFMLLQFDIVPTIQYNNYTGMYIATIYNAEKISYFLEEIGIQNAAFSKLQLAVSKIKRKASFDLRIPLVALSKKAQLMLTKSAYRDAKSCGINVLKNKFNFNEKVMNSDFMFDQINSIKKVKPTSNFVYDFKVEGYENFLGGEGFLFLHNTGDIKCIRTKLLEGADTQFPRLETLMIESTYGGKDNVFKPRKEAEEECLNFTNEVLNENGKVLIPVLGVGRAQEVVLIFEEAMRLGKIKKVPIFVQGMVWDVTAIHTAYPDFLNRDIKKAIFHKEENPFLSPLIKRVGSRTEQNEVINDGVPCIIIATSGMLTGGPSVEYFKQLCDNPKNGLLFVSYVGEGTLGRRIQNGEKTIILQDGGKPETLTVNMKVKIADSMSGHAGRNELMRYVSVVSPRPKKVIVNHGESSRCLDLASSVHRQNRIETAAPKNLESIRLK